MKKRYFSELNPEKGRLYKLIRKSSRPLYVTGKAGTGKSFLLDYFVDNARRRPAVLAPTGIAALNVHGQTIHSFFRLDTGIQNMDIIRKEELDEALAKKLRRVRTIVVDEASMVRVDVLAAMDFKLRKANNTTKPFGGKKVIFFGDLYQLPPVISDYATERYLIDRYGGAYFFNAFVFQREYHLPVYELQEVFRQKDDTFINILNHIRQGAATSEDLALLNQNCTDLKPRPESEHCILLTTSNARARARNLSELDLLDTELYEFPARHSPDVRPSSVPTEFALQLKVGAQVMMVANDPERRWVNGTLATISDLDDGYVEVEIKGRRYEVERKTWDFTNYSYNPTKARLEAESTSFFEQYPVRLAWAVTIHKSQGQTFDAVEIDLGSGTFSTGQAYVALSRCTNLEHLYLTRPLRPSDIKVDPAVARFMSRARPALPPKNPPK